MEVHLTFHASNEFRMKLLRSSYCYLPLEMHVKSVGLKCAEHNSPMMPLSEVIDRKSTQATALYLLHKTTFCQEHHLNGSTQRNAIEARGLAKMNASCQRKCKGCR